MPESTNETAAIDRSFLNVQITTSGSNNCRRKKRTDSAFGEVGEAGLIRREVSASSSA